MTYVIYSSMLQTKLICSECGSEVKQLGLVFKCQNLECGAQVPIDIDEINKQLAIVETENDRQLPSDQ